MERKNMNKWVANIPQNKIGTEFNIVGGVTGPVVAFPTREIPVADMRDALEQTGWVGVYATDARFEIQPITPEAAEWLEQHPVLRGPDCQAA